MYGMNCDESARLAISVSESIKIVTGIGKWVDLGQPIIGLLIAFCLIGQIFILFGRGTRGGNFNLVMSN